MPKRNFANWIEAYFDYARNGFSPDQFHLWSGISVLAGALERKISLPNGKMHFVPNFYVMLVSDPAVGKTTAMDPAVDLLEELRKTYNHQFRIIPNQVTEAALVDLMKIVDRILVPGTSIYFPQSAGYFYASEASSSALQNVCGDFVATMTAMYDCPNFFRKKLKGDRDVTEIEAVCMNMLSGTTFDYLKNLVDATSVMGGFASRLTYVIEKGMPERTHSWNANVSRDQDLRKKLIEDLVLINKLVGPMKATPEWIRLWEAYQKEFDSFLIALDDRRLRSLLSRKSTQITKLSMLLSVAESDSLELHAHHFTKAREMIETVTADAKMILTQAMIAHKDTQEGLNALIDMILDEHKGRIPVQTLKNAIWKNGNDVGRVDATLKLLIDAKQIHFVSSGVIERLSKTH